MQQKQLEEAWTTLVVSGENLMHDLRKDALKNVLHLMVVA